MRLIVSSAPSFRYTVGSLVSQYYQRAIALRYSFSQITQRANHFSIGRHAKWSRPSWCSDPDLAENHGNTVLHTDHCWDVSIHRVHVVGDPSIPQYTVLCPTKVHKEMCQILLLFH